MQETWVQSLVRDCCRATEPVLYNYRACILESGTTATEAQEPYSPRFATGETAAVRSLLAAPAHHNERQARTAVKTRQKQN